MIDKIFTAIGFSLLMVGGCGMDSENMLLPLICVSISALILIVEGVRYRDVI